MIKFLLFTMENKININSSDDPNYRYKMDKIIINKTGSGNGCFTNFNNLDIIASQLGHNKNTLLKYIGISLGSKINENSCWVQGHHLEENIQEIIFNFIKCFVSCSKCSVPELEYDLDKKGKIIKTHCLGCGFDGTIEKSILKKNNSKIFDKIISDIKNNFFKTNDKTTNIESSQDFTITTEFNEFF